MCKEYDMWGYLSTNSINKYPIDLDYGPLIPHFRPPKWTKIEFLNHKHLVEAGYMTKFILECYYVIQ